MMPRKKQNTVVRQSSLAQHVDSENMRLVQGQCQKPLGEAVPRVLESICLKCLRKVSSERYATAIDLGRIKNVRVPCSKLTPRPHI